jgi:hypothetical protein
VVVGPRGGAGEGVPSGWIWKVQRTATSHNFGPVRVPGPFALVRDWGEILDIRMVS